MISKIQWKPFWPAIQVYPQNDWTGWGFRVNYDVVRTGPISVLRKKESKTKKRMKEEEIENGDCGLPTRKVFFEIFSDLNEDGPVVYPANVFDSRLRGD